MRRAAMLTVVALVASACTGGGVETTTTMLDPTSSTVAPSSTTRPPPDPAYAEAIPLDPDVRSGVLANGLTYYVRRNGAPGGRLQLRLVVDAGSVLEDDDQSGAAHFLEHMMFNGTDRWPENELVAVLESFGARFGPDINAFTSFDETVYELEVATDDGTVALAFDVLREWASRATIAQADVEAERGVVVEEWRLRDQGISGRIGTLFETLLIAGTDYEGQAPIGDVDVLRATNAPELRRFYEDWYRPDLMAVIAVGDLPVDRLEDEIVSRFADLETPAAPRVRPEPQVTAPTAPRIVTFADPDLPTAFAEFLFPGPAIAAGSYGALRDSIGVQLAWDMVATRLDDDIAGGEADFFGVGAVEIPYARGLYVPGIEVDADADQLGSAVRAVAEEIERVRRHGFGDAEFRRAVERRRTAADQELASQRTRQDVEFAEALVATFLVGATLPAAEDAHELTIRALDQLTLIEVEASFLDAVVGAPAILAVGPDEAAAALPTEAQIEEILGFVVAGDVPPRPEETEGAAGLMDRPEPGVLVDRRPDIFDVTWLTFANGVVVGLVPTPISENTVVFGARSPGGTSVFERDVVVEAAAIGDIVASSGVGDFDRVALDRLLVGEVVAVTPYIDVAEEGMFGEAATEDLETLLQLVHLYMTAPRADRSAVDAYLSQIGPFVEAPLEIPGVAASVTMSWERYGRDNLWYTIPPADEVAAFDVDVALDAYLDRFGDAGDFVFALAGDLDVGDAERLAAAYLGTLPTSARADASIDRQPDPPPGAVTRTVQVGSDPQGEVSFLVTGALDAGPQDRIHVQLLELITSVRLRDRLREALSATYSPFVVISALDVPDPLVETYIQVSGDPERLDEISVETLNVLRDLAEVGPTPAELATAEEQLIRRFELVSNEFWVDTVLFYALRPDERLVDVADRIAVTASASVEDIRRLAAVAWPAGEYIEIRQVPE